MTLLRASCKACGHPISATTAVALLAAMAAHDGETHPAAVWAVGSSGAPLALGVR